MATPRRAKKKPAARAPSLPTKSTVAPVAPAKPIAVASVAKVTKKGRAEYLSLLREMEVAEFDELRGWDRRWEAIGTILHKNLFLLDEEAPTAQSWVEKHTSETYRTALRNTRVALVASPEEEKRYKSSKIDLAITVELKKQLKAAEKAKVAFDPRAAAEKIVLSKLRYTVERAGKKVSVDLEAITAEELSALATGKPRPANKPSEATAPKTDEGRAVSSAIAKNKSLSGITVAERDHQLTLASVRFDQAAELGRALSKLSFDE